MSEEKNCAYKRVSSTEQNTARQLEGILFDKVFEDKLSGKNVDRPALKECLEFVREGDVLHVHEISRLARNLSDLLLIVQGLTTKGVAVHFHKENLIFTGQGEDPMSNLMLSLLGAIAAFERSLILERQAEGIKAAMKRGIKFGRPEKLLPADKEEIKARAVVGQSKDELAKIYGVSRPTIYSVLKQA